MTFTQGFTVSGCLLKLLKIGERGVITALKNLNEDTQRKLTAMGVKPGTSITLEQRSPRFVVRTRSNRVALSDPMIQSIYVRLNNSYL
jgi:ferrous iron transport protein A